MTRGPVNPVLAALVMGEEFCVRPDTALLVLLLILMAQDAGCSSSGEGREWAIREGYVEVVGDDNRVTDYGEWAACVWARMSVDG